MADLSSIGGRPMDPRGEECFDGPSLESEVRFEEKKRQRECLERNINALLELGYVTEGKLCISCENTQETMHAHIAVQDGTVERTYRKLKLLKDETLSSRRYLVFIVGKFMDHKSNTLYLGYAKHLEGEQGKRLTEICLVPANSVIDYFGLTKTIPVLDIS